VQNAATNPTIVLKSINEHFLEGVRRIGDCAPFWLPRKAK
jgi:hypothetical protein